MQAEKRELARWWMWVLALLVLTAVVLGVLNAFGIIGRTVLEREVFERSFQYSEARKAEIATYQAQLAEIERKLLAPDLTAAQRSNLESQAAAIRVRLSVAKFKEAR